jgi:hypothetical protein
MWGKKTNMMVTRRPMYCETIPAMAPPAIAPQLPIIVATVALCDENPFVVLRYVGYRSCDPCERKLNPESFVSMYSRVK